MSISYHQRDNTEPCFNIYLQGVICAEIIFIDKTIYDF